MKHILIILLITNYLTTGIINAQKQPDAIQIENIVNSIEALGDDAYKKAIFFSELDHLYIERYGQLLFPYIKNEYDNLKVNSDLPLALQFEIVFFMKNTYYLFREHDKAAKLAYEMLDIAKQLNDSLYYYYAYISIADIETEVGNNESSLEFLLKAQKYAIIDTSALAQTYIDLAALHLDDLQLERVKENALIGIALAEKMEDYLQLSYGYSILMNYYIASEDFNKALKTYQTVDSITKNNHFLETSRTFANVTIRAAQVYKELGEYDLATDFYQCAYTIAKESNDRHNLLFIYDEWSELEELKGDFEKSLAYFKQHVLLQDSLYNEETIFQINTLKALHDLATKEHEIEVTKQKESNTKKQFWLSLIIGIILIIALTTLSFLLRSRLKQEKLKAKLIEKQNKLTKIEVENLEREIQLKNKKLADLFLHQFEKATMLNHVMETVDVSSSKLKKILAEHHNKKQDWINFKAHFDEVHEGFFDKLNALSPDLTPKDIRFCAYLRMNLSSKEIAIMLGISHRTVQGIKSRVRKKIQLDSDQDIVKFLMNL